MTGKSRLTDPPFVCRRRSSWTEVAPGSAHDYGVLRDGSSAAFFSARLGNQMSRKGLLPQRIRR
jgi:hypothetical protein